MSDTYYAVIFTSKLNNNFKSEYKELAEKIHQLAQIQPGFLGSDSARNEIGITVSYWKDEESIRNWKKQTEHIEAQLLGKLKFYSYYSVRVCKVEREYSFNPNQH